MKTNNQKRNVKDSKNNSIHPAKKQNSNQHPTKTKKFRIYK